MDATVGSDERVVLVVDDDETIRFVVGHGLRLMGYRADEADGGEAALAKLIAAPAQYSCCLLDLTMPGYEGASLARELAIQAPAMPFVVMSGMEEGEAREQFAGVPIRAYLAKPFTMEQLGDAVRQALAASPSTAAD